MKKSFRDAVLHRRTYYSITNTSPVSDSDLEEIVKFAVRNVPSAFNSQSTRVVLLLGDNHLKLWDIVMQALRAIVPAESFAPTQAKIDSFAAGYGTLLYFEDQQIVQSLENRFPLYAANFPIWSNQSSAMHQFTIWTMLEDAGLGASLQHYNELIADKVCQEWSLPNSWKLIAQMPFGTPIANPGDKSFEPIEQRVLVFK